MKPRNNIDIKRLNVRYMCASVYKNVFFPHLRLIRLIYFLLDLGINVDFVNVVFLICKYGSKALT